MSEIIAPPKVESSEPADAFALVDGENIDCTLGDILGTKPTPKERPDWTKVLVWLKRQFGPRTQGLFFVNVSRSLPTSFISALSSIGWTPVPVTGSIDQKIVDVAILKTLAAIHAFPARKTIVLFSHDKDFLPALVKAHGDGHKVAAVGFRPYFPNAFEAVPGIQRFDMRDDIGAFNVPLTYMTDAYDVNTLNPETFLRKG